MKEQRIIVEIDHEGHITADADGFSGDACLHDLEQLLDGLAEWESIERKDGADDRTITRAHKTRLGMGGTP